MYSEFKKLALSEKSLFLGPAVMFLTLVLRVVGASFPRRLCILHMGRSVWLKATYKEQQAHCSPCFLLENYEQVLGATGCIWEAAACQYKHGLWSLEAGRAQCLNLISLGDKKKKNTFLPDEIDNLLSLTIFRSVLDSLISKHPLFKDDDQGNISTKGPGLKGRVSFPGKGLWFCSTVTV